MTLCHLPPSILPNYRPPFDFFPNNENLSNKNTDRTLLYKNLNNNMTKINEENLERKTLEKEQ